AHRKNLITTVRYERRGNRLETEQKQHNGQAAQRAWLRHRSRLRGKGEPHMNEQMATPEKKTNGAISRWDPADMFQALHQEMDRFWPRTVAFPFAPVPPQGPAKTGL